MIKRLYPVVFIFLLAVPLLLAQDSGSNDSQPANLGGSWQLSWQNPGGSEQATIQIQQDGSALSGSFQDSRGSSQLTGSIDGNKVSFSVQVQGRRTVTLAFAGTVDGDKMSGSVQSQGGGGRRGGQGGGQGKIPGAPFANRASPEARVHPLKTWMKTTNTEFESQLSCQLLHASFAPYVTATEELAGRYALRISPAFHPCSFVSAGAGFRVNCAGVDNCDRFHSPPRASISSTAEVISST